MKSIRENIDDSNISTLMLCSLPKSYDRLITTLAARPENELSSELFEISWMVNLILDKTVLNCDMRVKQKFIKLRQKITTIKEIINIVQIVDLRAIVCRNVGIWKEKVLIIKDTIIIIEY